MQPDIVYEDEELVVCYKEAGMAVQSSRVGQMDLESLMRNYVSGRENTYLALINRLDQPVEGLVLFARTPKAAADLSEQISTHSADKEYLAITDGIFTAESGKLEDYMKKDAKKRMAVLASPKDRQAKKACLEYRKVCVLGGQQLLHIRLLTGRFHQIRLQLSHAGCPIVGDMRYNPACAERTGRMFP